MRQNKDVSILLPVYDGDDDVKFEACLKSIKHELGFVDQVVIVLDGYVSETKTNLINRFIPNNLLRLIKLPVNKGLVNALNVGLQNINSKYAARVDADDIIIEGRIKIQKLYMEKYKLDICSSHIEEFGGFYNEITLRKIPISATDILTFMKLRSPFNHMATMYHVDKIRRLGGYPNIFNNEDYALWLAAAAQKLELGNVDAVLMRADVPKEFLDRRAGIKRARAELQLFQFRRKLRLYPLHVDLIALIIRSSFRMLPVFLLKKLYRMTRNY